MGGLRLLLRCPGLLRLLLRFEFGELGSVLHRCKLGLEFLELGRQLLGRVLGRLWGDEWPGLEPRLLPETLVKPDGHLARHLELVQRGAVVPGVVVDGLVASLANSVEQLRRLPWKESIVLQALDQFRLVLPFNELPKRGSGTPRQQLTELPQPPERRHRLRREVLLRECRDIRQHRVVDPQKGEVSASFHSRVSIYLGRAGEKPPPPLALGGR